MRGLRVSRITVIVRSSTEHSATDAMLTNAGTKATAYRVAAHTAELAAAQLRWKQTRYRRCLSELYLFPPARSWDGAPLYRDRELAGSSR